jgi:hypothetical protein
MKGKLSKVFVALAVSILLLSACQLPSGIATKSVTDKFGTVKITLPRVAPWITTSTTASKSLNSKAFAFVDQVEVDFYQDTVLTKAVVMGPSSYDESTNTITGSVTVPSATYTKVIVSVFNLAVSDTVPIVAGLVENVAVPVSGVVNIDVTLFPCAPVALPTDGTYSPEVTLNLNGEQWYSFMAPDTKTKVTVKSNTGNMDIYIFNPDGKVINDASGTSVEESVAFDTTVFDRPYYVCMIARTAGSAGQVKYGSGINYGSIGITIH